MAQYNYSLSKSIDVCMATYNGEKYLKRQIESIFSQTEPVGQIIVSDDASSDKTISVLKEIEQIDITILFNKQNLGHVGNFERALTRSSAEIIFLSDQDDVWIPNKVERVMSIFKENPDVVMIHHNLTTVDETEKILQERYISLPSGKQNSFGLICREFVKPRLFGCAMAFRRRVLDVLLPFPSCVYAHDHWIAVASACIGKIYFLNEDLVFYRQHVGNLTPKSRRSVSKILSNRFLFAQMIFHALTRSRRLRSPK